MTTNSFDTQKTIYRIARDVLFSHRLRVTSVNPTNESETSTFTIEQPGENDIGLTPIFTRDVIEPTDVIDPTIALQASG